MKITFFTEGGKGKGYGHISRTTTLAEEFLNKRHSIEFITDYPVPTIFKLLHNNINYKNLFWQSSNTLTSEFPQFISEIIIVDSYTANEEIYKILHSKTKLLCYFDDTERIDYPPGILINGAYNAEKIYLHKNNNIHYLVGSHFQMVRKPFRKNFNKKISEKITKILITIGGNDTNNTLDKIINTLINNFPEINLYVITGENIPKVNSENIKIFKNITADEMLNIMLQVDIAISAGGQTLYELAITGTPTIALIIAENQKHNVESLSEANFLLNIGQIDNETEQRLISAIYNLQKPNVRKSMSENGKKIITSKGASNIYEKIMKIYKQNQNM